MADSPETDAIVKKEPDAPARDPIASRSTSGIMLICALLLMGSLAWALYDEAYGQRPWKNIQKEFVARYTRYLKSIRNNAGSTEKEVRESPDFQKFDDEAKAAQAEAKPRTDEIDKEVASVQKQLDAVTDPFQDARGKITVLNYNVETASDSNKNSLRQKVEQEKQRQIVVYLPASDNPNKTQKQNYNYAQLEKIYNDLKDKKSSLLSERAEVNKEYTELAKKRDDYLKNHLLGLSPGQIDSLVKKNNEAFSYDIHQINVNSTNIVDRCETCHLGTREPLKLTAEDMAPDGPGKKPDDLARAFVNHPRKELLQIHDPERFGCSACHGGNGRATTSAVKAHGLNPFWLHPLYRKENTEAGCQQCHSSDRVLDFAPTLNLGKDLFYQRGCVGCHRYEGFDKEADGLSGARQAVSQLQDQITANEKQQKQDEEDANKTSDDAEAQRLLAHAESVRVTNSQLAAKIDELNLQSRYLMMDQKKVGPNLKDVRLKLRKEWIPVWLQNPQAFRPGTKMPTFWRIDGEGNRRSEDNDRESNERKAIAAYLWQEGFDGKVPEQKKEQGNAGHGKELFESRGCLACHSIGQGDDAVGGTFAANLSRVGDKANFDYIVRWIHNPRERWAPYCPKEKRDLTSEDYQKNNKPFVFDTDHSTCPNDGAELQVQNMTVMPNFRLSESDARDIASYLFSLSGDATYPDASFMDDANLKEQGKTLIKQYGCAGCHEIKGFEEEQRIGKELTAEGSTPIERLDFALMTKDAEDGNDPLNLHPKEKGEEWYNHRGFFEHKLADPSVYDRGKEKDPKDQLRMPKPYLTDEWRTALTTFLLGSVGPEGASVPESAFYKPLDRRKDIQEGWWVIKKYNCMGCHNVQVGQRSVLMDLAQYQTPDGKDQLPPRLTSEGARVNPEWLLRFLHDPSLSDEKNAGGTASPTSSPSAKVAEPVAQSPASATAAAEAKTNGNQQQSQGGAKLKPQPGADRNGVRVYLKVRMPTFNFSPNELRTLVRFFMAVSAQQDPYIPEPQTPLTDQERLVARQLFTSGTPCLKCHITGDPVHDKTAIAPNFLLANERLKPDWTFRWLLDPAQISPGTAMPSQLFKKEGERWVANLAQPPPLTNDYHGDHAKLLVRYMFQLTKDEQQRLLSASPAATGGAPPAQKEAPKQTASMNKSGGQKISRDLRRRGKREKTVARLSADYNRARAPNVSLSVSHGPLSYSP
ncbi:MAG: c-type cytochrome [Pyrinomonadaceae bacterium]